MTDDTAQVLSQERNKNSQLQARLMQAEKQVKDSFLETTKMRDEHQYEKMKLNLKLEEMQNELNETKGKFMVQQQKMLETSIDKVDILRKASERANTRTSNHTNNSRVQSPDPMQTSVEFVNEVKQMQK